MDDKSANEFQQVAVEQADRSVLVEFWDFLRYNKKWWLLPIVIVLFVIGVLILLGGTAVAPFIYTLF